MADDFGLFDTDTPAPNPSQNENEKTEKPPEIVYGSAEEISSPVVMQDSLVLAMPHTHRLAGASRLALGRPAGDGFVSLTPFEGAVLPDRLHRLAQEPGFVADVVQVAPDTQTALALVSAEVGCHLTLASVRQACHPSACGLVPRPLALGLRAWPN